MTNKSEDCNFCLVYKNKFYGEVYDILNDEDLYMNNQDHYSKIYYEIKKIIYNSKLFKISDSVNNSEKLLEELMIQITSNNNDKDMQGNTLLIYGDDEKMYEIIYLEDLVKEQIDDNLNEFCSISNIELEPVYYESCIIKTVYENNIYKNVKIDLNDIVEIAINNFYHIGVMINEDNSMIEITFSGDNPITIIGSNFIKQEAINIFDFIVVPYLESKDTNLYNNNGSNLLGKEVSNRLFILLLCPINHKKIWNINSKTILALLDILDDKDKINKLYKDIEKNDKINNPFFLIKKYCI